MTFHPPSNRQIRIMWLALTGLAIAMLVTLVVALIWGLGHVVTILSPVLWPLATAGILAYLLDPVVDFLQQRGMPRMQAILCVFVLALLILVAFFGSVVPQLIVETRQLISQIPSLVVKAEKRISYWVDHPPGLVKKLLEREQTPEGFAATHDKTNEMVVVDTNAVQGLPATNVVIVAEPATNAIAVTGTNAPSGLAGAIDKQTLQTATSWLAGQLPKAGEWLFGQVGRVASLFGFFIGLALIPVYAFYFLLEKDAISSRWTDYLPVADSRFKEEMVFILASINNYLIAFFRGQVLVAIIDGILYGVGFVIIGLPYAILLGVMAIFLTIIPFLGAIVTLVVSLIISVVQYGDWLHPMLVLVVFAIVQTLESVVISPKILGDRVGLHPVTIIVAVMAGTTLLGGLLGGILAIPLTAALRVIMFRYVWKRPENSGKGKKD